MADLGGQRVERGHGGRSHCVTVAGVGGHPGLAEDGAAAVDGDGEGLRAADVEAGGHGS